jgi:hypothetical protein
MPCLILRVDARVGGISAKREDTAFGILRKECGADVARGVRPAARLGDIREHTEPQTLQASEDDSVAV